MLSINWNGSKGAVHFWVTAARKSLTVCACTPVTTSASAHSAVAVSFLMGVSFSSAFLVRTDVACFSRAAANYVAIGAAATGVAQEYFAQHFSRRPREGGDPYAVSYQ